MGTFASVTTSAREGHRIEEYAARSTEALSKLEAMLSVYRPDSEISRLNKSAGGAPVPLSPTALEVLEASARYAELTGGAFDITVAPLVKLWGFSGGKKPNAVPDPSAIRTAMDISGMRRLSLTNGTAMLKVPGATVDLGGIAKGYAVDMCFNELRAMGAVDIMVNLGGNIRCAGVAERYPDGTPLKPWVIGVRNPFSPDGLLGTLRLTNGMAVATSGNYENFVTIQGERYTHIIDPTNGMPVRGMASVTVISSTAVETDALSTGLFVLGPDKASVLTTLPHAEALFVRDTQPPTLSGTVGFFRLFTPEPAYVSGTQLLPYKMPPP